MAFRSRPLPPSRLPPSPSSSVESDQTIDSLGSFNKVLHHSLTPDGGVQLRPLYRSSDNLSSTTFSTDCISSHDTDSTCSGLPGPGRTVGYGMAVAGRYLEKWVTQAQVVLKERRQIDIQVTKEVKMVNHCGKGCLSCHDSSNRTFKILLLGAGESGKSALFKQLQNRWGPSFSSDTTLGFTIVYRCLQYLRQLLEMISDEVSDPFIQAQLDVVETLLRSSEPTDPLGGSVPRPDTMAAIWKHPSVQRAVAHPEAFQHTSSLSYFIQHWRRVAAPSYIPTEEDVLAYTYRTNGIDSFLGLEGTLEVIDTGGQLCERRKWPYLSNDVDVVLFVVSLTQFAERMDENYCMNRMCDSLDLFASVCKDHAYREATILLIFTKGDLFVRTLSSVTLQQAFPEYIPNIDQEPGTAMKYIEQKFIDAATSAGKLAHIIHTNSFDRDSSDAAVEAIRATLLHHPYQAEGSLKASADVVL